MKTVLRITLAMIVSGWFGSACAADIWLLKTDSLGDTIWTRTYDMSRYANLYLRPLRDGKGGGYMITGGGLPPDKRKYIYSSSCWDFFAIKTDVEGNALWEWSWFDGYVNWNLPQYDSMAVWEAATIEVDSCGDTAWIFKGVPDIRRLDWDVDIFIACQNGGTVWLVTDSDILNLFKVEPKADSVITVWHKLYEGGDTISYVGTSIKQTLDRGFVFTGSIRDNRKNSSVLWLEKTDSLGNSVWRRTYEQGQEGKGWYLRLTPDEGFMILGTSGKDE
ncbi:hypothetical protein JXM67_09775 [candidate division WOR-3 bacterium]|nr:hypothetical protein [candidate division WOR-3 bacterium]